MRSRSFSNKVPIIVPRRTPRSVWKPATAPVKSGMSCVTVAPAASSFFAAVVATFATSFDIGTISRSVLKATRRGIVIFSNASKNFVLLSKEKGSSGWWPAPASSMRATSVTFRAIGPSTQRVSKACSRLPLGTTPGPGLNPTTPLNPAGVRKLPPRSFPVASQACPLASAAPDPPDEPPALRFKFHGFRVIPLTELNVCPPAHSGTFDFAIGMAPCDSSIWTVASEVSGM